MKTPPGLPVVVHRAAIRRYIPTVITLLLASFTVSRAGAATYDPPPTPYCTISYDDNSAYTGLEAEVTGTNPSAKELAQFVLEAFAQANANNALLDGTSQSDVVVALQRLGTMWVSGSLNFKSNYLDSTTSDPNQVQFVTESMAQICYRFPILLAQYGPVGTNGTIENMLSTLYSEGQSGAYAEPLPVSYTNMWLMQCCNLVLTGQGLVDGSNHTLLAANTTMVNTGRTNLINWISTLRTDGIHEFMSAAYTGLDLECLGYLNLYSADPSIESMAQQGYKLIWLDMYANWFYQDQRMGGTHSRTYEFLTDEDHETDRFFYAVSNLITEPDPAWPPLLTGRTQPAYWRGQDFIAYVLPPPSDVPLLFPATVPVGSTRTILRDFNDGTIPFMYGENYMANPAGLGGLSYPFSIGTTQSYYDDVTFEGYTIEVTGSGSTANVNYNMQSRKDYYLQNPSVGGKAATLIPFIAGVQNGAEALFLAASNGKLGPDSPGYSPYTVEVASSIVFPNTTQVWIGNSATSQHITAGQSVAISSGTTIFLRTSNAGETDGLVTGIRFLASTSMSGSSIGLSIIDDGTSYNAMRVTCEHSAVTPTSGYGVLAYWSRTAYCSDTSTNFNAFRSAMTSSTVTASLNYTTGTCSYSVPGLHGTMSIVANAINRTITTSTGGDVQGLAPLLAVDGTEYLDSTVLSWTGSNIGTATSGSGALLTSGTLYNGQIQVVGGGSDIWGSADSFEFYYQELTGNGTIIGHLTSMPSGGGISADAKAGVMLRNDLTAGSINALMSQDGTVGEYFSTRATANGSSSRKGNTTTTLPYWFKITRVGNLFTGYSSPDGVTWTQIGNATTLVMGDTIYAGLAVTSQNNSQPLTTVFDNVGIIQQ